MRHPLQFAVLTAAVVLAPSFALADDRANTETVTTTAADVPDHERPFRRAAQAFVDAYAKRDAQAIGNLFTEDAEFYDEDGELTEGRKAIVGMFADVFRASPDALVDEIDIERVRLVAPNVAIEEGRVATSAAPGRPRRVTRYIALHVRSREGIWRINTLKDYSDEKSSAAEHLRQLGFLVGAWVNEDAGTLVNTEARWSDDGNYVLRRFTVKFDDRPVMNGTQRIGWDPVRKEIRSWTFDSRGGFVEGRWTRSGDQWIVVSTGYTAAGDKAAGVAVFTIHDAERLTWQFRSILVGDELRENVEPVVLVRRPPTPETAGK